MRKALGGRGMVVMVTLAVAAVSVALMFDSGHPSARSPLEASFTGERRRLSESTNASTSDESSHDDEHEGAHTDNGLLFAALMVGMGVMVQQLLLLTGEYFPLPYTVALVILGGLFGSLNSIGTCVDLHNTTTEALQNATACSEMAPRQCKDASDQCEFVSTLPSSLGLLATSLDTWANIDPNFLLYFFIPALVYASAHVVDVHIFRESFINVLSLAIPGVLLATYLMYFFFFNTYHDNDRYGWSFEACMTFGAILSATDPVAVVALLDDLGAPHKLSIAIEGESLLNDGTALVLYKLFSEALLGNENNLGDQFVFFIRLALGGFGTGVIFGAITVLMLQFLASSLLETTWTFGAAYLTFFVCENENVQFSGVIGVVFLGVTVSLFGHTRLTSPEFMEHFWTMWNFVANTLIFSIAGVIIAENTFFEEHVEAEDWGTLFVVYGIQLLIRAAVIAVLSPILYFSGRRHGYELGWREMILLWWSGLRGAVGLILALELSLQPTAGIVDDQQAHCNVSGTNPDCEGHWYIIGDGSLEDAERFQALLTFFVAGFALLTLLINGVTTRYLVSCLGVTHKRIANKYEF